jgi:hypothetical protein
VILYPIAKGKFRRQFNRLVTAKLSDIMWIAVDLCFRLLPTVIIRKRFPNNTYLCQMNAFFMNLVTVETPLTLTLFSLDRFIYSIHPEKYVSFQNQVGNSKIEWYNVNCSRSMLSVTSYRDNKKEISEQSDQKEYHKKCCFCRCWRH